MPYVRAFVLIVLASSLLLSLPPASHAQQELSPGCTHLNDPMHDGLHPIGATRGFFQFYAGETVTFTGLLPSHIWPPSFHVSIIGPDERHNLTVRFPGPLTYTFTSDLFGRVIWDAVAAPPFEMEWDITCAWTGLPPTEEESAEAPLPGCDVLLPIPPGSVMGTFLVDVVADYAPGITTPERVTLPQGQTAWVLGMDAAHATYKIAWACTYLWVPVSAMGPTYDALWQGWPLPTGVVE